MIFKLVIFLQILGVQVTNAKIKIGRLIVQIGWKKFKITIKL